MDIAYRAFKDVPLFSDTDIAYAQHDPKLLQFARYKPDLETFAQVIADKSKDQTDRALLTSVLKEQYAAFSTPVDKALEQVEKLKQQNTYTVTTAHQPVLFTGPLYVVYKIISAIQLTEEMSKRFPEQTFIPVFVTGGEDHDFDEMDHTYLYGNRISWSNDASGPVGRMDTSSLKDALAELRDILGESDAAQEIYQLFEKTHTSHKQYGMAFADLINGLFGAMGLVVINMDVPELKRKMVPIFKDELVKHTSSSLVRDTQSQVEASGFKPQAYVRDINLFYLGPGFRERIELEDGVYKVVNQNIQFTEAEILAHLEEAPERFSPNVVMRPLYQETILPNLAYVGGGGEIAYWLERKSQFEHFRINFPMLVRRDSALWIDRTVQKRIAKLELDISDFFKEEATQIKDFVASAAEHEFKLGKEKGQIMQIYKAIEEKAKAIDPTLRSTIAAEGVNQVKALEKLEDKLRKAEKQKHEIALGQLQKVREKLFPNGGLQERVTSFLDFYSRMPDDYFTILQAHFNPLDTRLKILSP